MTLGDWKTALLAYWVQVTENGKKLDASVVVKQ